MMFCGILLLHLVCVCSLILELWFYCWSAAALCVLIKYISPFEEGKHILKAFHLLFLLHLHVIYIKTRFPR